MSVIVINDDTHTGTPMTAHQTLLIQVGEMTIVVTPGDPITPIGVGIVTINRHNVEHDIIAEGTQGFLLTSQKMKALTGTMTMVSAMKLPMQMKSCNEFAR